MTGTLTQHKTFSVSGMKRLGSLRLPREAPTIALALSGGGCHATREETCLRIKSRNGEPECSAMKNESKCDYWAGLA